MPPAIPRGALARIRGRGHIGIRLGLERMRALLDRLGDPQAALRGVLIAGTNGKGSTAAMVAAMAQAAGLSTGQSPSPHLVSERERITIDGRPIASADLDGLLEEVLRASEPGEAEHGPATEFELFTAAAYLWAARRAVDVMVMEVGLGGRLDASSTWLAQVAAITSVSLDHQEFLGSTVASVAAEKAAIIRPGCRAVTGARGDALEVIRARAAAVGAPLTVRAPLEVLRHGLDGLLLRDEHLGILRSPLLGRHQARNAAVAIGIAGELGEAGVAVLPAEAIAGGLATVRWPGRLELVAGAGRRTLLDGAHNPEGAAALAAALDELCAGGSLPGGRVTLLLGVLRDKAVAEILAALSASRALGTARVIATRVPGSARALPAPELAAAWDATVGRPAAESLDDADEALDRALAVAAEADGLLLVTGSLYLVGHVRARLLPALDGEEGRDA